jgi:inner membrane protein
MASIGHVAVGVAAARVYRNTPAAGGPPRSSILFWSALSMLPDADVIGFTFGIDYAAPWGHRGATHSLPFALAVAAVAALAAPRFGFRASRTMVVASVVVASHGLLDTLTDGGLGCALFWPFALVRHFAPWRPIPVSPIGLAFLSPYGLFVAMTELVFFAPLVMYGLKLRLNVYYWLPLWIADVALILGRR